jgi:hypothetical protein
MQSTKLVLGISNWHFNRDTQHLVEGPHCRLEDVNLTFKLASTAFSADEGGSSSTASTEASIGDNSQLKYDRNGAIVPYPAFLSLMEQELFHDYMKKLQHLYEQKEGPISSAANVNTESTDDDIESNANQSTEDCNNVEEEEEEEEEEEVVKRSSKRPAKVLSETEDDNEENSAVTENPEQQQQQQPQAPSTKTTRRGAKKQNVDS